MSHDKLKQDILRFSARERYFVNYFLYPCDVSSKKKSLKKTILFGSWFPVKFVVLGRHDGASQLVSSLGREQRASKSSGGGGNTGNGI